MIDRFLLFMKMFIVGFFKFAFGIAVYLISITTVLVIAEVISRVKILSLLLLIILAGVIVFCLFIIGEDFWHRYKIERDSRGL